ncbi:TonB-dependent receptor [uncultured Draconibacterium sp.]|uniref:SusC/RagA family TonB-linked outer membrane protein n=1 Tax=uncultured Draconibacterium sp. TaxID=1573823 RepID=UPI003217BA0A
MKLLRKVKKLISRRKYVILYLFLLPWMLFQVESAMGQTEIKTVRGKVSDTGNLPLPGVTVFLKGTTIGTTTNADGVYNLTKVPENSTLVFSFVGMKTQEIAVSTRTTIDVVLESETIGLDEVVAIGYGTQKKKDLTGSIVRMEMDGKEQAANTSLVQALQGYSPGLNASGGSSAGDGGSFSIRGRTSLSASDQPLVVLDGIIYNGSINDLNINDIQSVDILKDASAAAVYGSRSANGVLVVTTKKGTSGKPKFTFNAYYGVQNLSNTERTNVMNAEQYAVRLVDYYYQQDLYAWYKTGPTSAEGRPARPDVTDRDLVASYLRTEEEQINYLGGNSVDWVDEVFQTSPIQSYSLSVSGKTERTNYYLSTSYLDQEGILLNDNYKRLTFNGRFESKIANWLTVGFDPTFSHRDYSGVSASAGYALQASPLGNMYDESGNYPVYIAGESYNYHPLGNLLAEDSSPRDYFSLVLKGIVEVPWVKGLKYEANYSKTYDFDKTSRYYPTSMADGSKTDGSGYVNNANQRTWLLNSLFTYNRTFADKHSLSANYLYSRENISGDGSYLYAYGFANELLGYNALELGENQEVSTSAYEENTISYMGRINYSYDSRYLLTATIRRDGFSGFGGNKKFGNFPSLSLGWVISEESFMDEVDWMDFLKLRLSYGINGNQGIGRYASQSKMGSLTTVFDGATAVGLYANSLGNADLGWEKTASLNAGIDFNFLDNRISGSIDAYNAKTTDVLVQRSIPRMSGNSSVWTNIGGIENNGVEVSLVTENIKTRDFKWKTAFAFSLVRNKITKLYDDVTEDLGNSWFIGEPISTIYGYVNDGVWQEDELFNGTIMADYYPGQFKVRDLNDDGTITSEDDREILGTTDPNYRISMNNILTYKNFTFSFFFNSIQGGNNYYMANNSGAVVAGATDSAYRLNRTAIRDYWRPDNAVNDAPGIYYNPKKNPGVYQSKSFVRLQDVSLGYTFDNSVLSDLKIDNLKVYVSGKNLYTWTKWSGWDPETGSPMMRSIIGGVNISF